MTKNKEIRLFIALVYTIAIILVTGYILLNGQPEETTEIPVPAVAEGKINKTEGSAP